MTEHPDSLSLTARRVWIDGSGVEWHRRNGDVTLARLRQVLRDQSATVLHQYDDVVDVGFGDRQALLARLEPYLRGKADRSTGDHTEFTLAEFKCADHRSLIVIDESC